MLCPGYETKLDHVLKVMGVSSTPLLPLPPSPLGFKFINGQIHLLNFCINKNIRSYNNMNYLF